MVPAEGGCKNLTELGLAAGGVTTKFCKSAHLRRPVWCTRKTSLF